MPECKDIVKARYPPLCLKLVIVWRKSVAIVFIKTDGASPWRAASESETAGIIDNLSIPGKHQQNITKMRPVSQMEIGNKQASSLKAVPIHWFIALFIVRGLRECWQDRPDKRA